MRMPRTTASQGAQGCCRACRERLACSASPSQSCPGPYTRAFPGPSGSPASYFLNLCKPSLVLGPITLGE